jgi:hypothetical protein
VADIKKYNLKGVNAELELGKQGSYISGNADAVSFFDKTDALQKLSIANATLAGHAITKAQLDAAAGDLVQHFTVEFDYTSGTVNLANVTAGARILGVTVDIPTAWGGTSDNTTTFVEIGDSGNQARFIRTGDVDVLTGAQYHSQYQYEYDSDDTIKLTLTPGSATSGVGSVSCVISNGIVSVTDYGLVQSSADVNSDLGNIA